MRKILFLLLWLPLTVFANSLGDVAENLLGPTAFVTKLVIVACYAIGAILILMSFAQYKIHRQTPKLVPLTTPIALLILGIIALLIPYVTKMGGAEPAENTDQKRNVLPLPDTTSNRGPTLPLPGEPAVSPGTEQAPPSPPPPSQDSGSSDGHWSQGR